MTPHRAAAASIVLGLGLLAPWAMPAEGQQPAPAGQTQPVEPAKFLEFAYSSALFQERAATLAASRDTRPEVKEFAQAMVSFRQAELPKLEALARERNLRLPSENEFEHRVVLENLEPLDYLALSRRYAEVQVQALEQEIRGFEAAGASADAGLQAIAEETLPALRQQLEAAQRVLEAVKA
jgi:predicted outer membrane protein